MLKTQIIETEWVENDFPRPVLHRGTLEPKKKQDTVDTELSSLESLVMSTSLARRWQYLKKTKSNAHSLNDHCSDGPAMGLVHHLSKNGH